MTLQDAQNNRDAWIQASQKLARGQVARIGDQRLDRSDWDMVKDAINFWRSEVARIERQQAGGSRLSIGYATFPCNTL